MRSINSRFTYLLTHCQRTNAVEELAKLYLFFIIQTRR